MKICASCKCELSIDNFHKKKSTKDGLHNYCKICTATKNKKWVIDNKDKHKETCKNWYSLNKEKANLKGTDWHYRKHYGITHQYFLELAKQQENKCKICNSTLSFNKEKTNDRAVLDHCHVSNKIRGILCNNCNTSLGKFKDDINILQSAIRYLQENSN